MYGVIIQVYGDLTQVLLFIELPEDTPGKRSTEENKRVYDEFWAAVEAHL